MSGGDTGVFERGQCPGALIEDLEKGSDLKRCPIGEIHVKDRNLTRCKAQSAGQKPYPRGRRLNQYRYDTRKSTIRVETVIHSGTKSFTNSCNTVSYQAFSTKNKGGQDGRQEIHASFC